MTILILGGTTEAAELARHLAERHPGIAAEISLAGRTSTPKPLAVPTRTGGFGGAAGLAAYLTGRGIAAVVDATHPFAAVMPFNAAAACRAAGVPLLALRRPAWIAKPGDRWNLVATMAAAADALGSEPRRVFLTIGRQELGAFATRPQHAYLVRSIEPIGDVLDGLAVTAIEARGPFTDAEEVALMRAHRIEILVSKNAGGSQTRAKLAAARSLGLTVVMVQRPAKPPVETVAAIDAAVAWLSHHGLVPTDRGV
ncbi:cobalt-precorrin-6A reductase [Phreatobacter sp. AB_2022a]|uniref:cobalt-precorrin-6A reductase n=1 Tax=Phreatobacter sp. AB_2022a TaxID=3003134 RepID=UPI0022872A2F|nr:cobalt-precorrin-6A reductase [Phreatobacter sp. AB_2022a]MCZ0736601.1 cobalt-precorrin-6A reductase [Phreatobacter sp. AB_2022a]